MDGLSDKMEIIVIFSLLVLPIITWIIASPLSEWSKTANPWTVIALHLLLTPAFLVLMWLSYEKWGLKGLAVAIIIVFASEVINLPQAIKNPIYIDNPQMPIDNELYLTPDASLYRIVSDDSGQVTILNHFLTYVLIPIALGFGALIFAGIDIVNRVWRGG